MSLCEVALVGGDRHLNGLVRQGALDEHHSTVGEASNRVSARSHLLDVHHRVIHHLAVGSRLLSHRGRAYVAHYCRSRASN